MATDTLTTLKTTDDWAAKAGTPAATSTSTTALVPQQPTALAPASAVGPAKDGLSTGQKVGVGVGVTSAVGLAAFGVFRLGKHQGWWSNGTLILDDADTKGGGKSSDGGKSSNGSTSRKRAVGKPPNISGDPEGYNTDRFKSPGPVRLTMNSLGYKVAFNDQTLVPNNKPHPQVSRFQADWNRVIRGIDAGRVKLPAQPREKAPLAFFRGILGADGIPGKNTLNALEVVFRNWFVNKLIWSEMVKEAQ